MARVPSLSLTAMPKYVFCGGDVPCPEITPKTLALHVPEPEPPVVQKEQEKKTLSTTVRTTVRFAFNRHDIKPSARKALTDLLQEIRKAESESDGGSRFMVMIDGYTDSIGPNAYNDRLALKRALAVKRYLISAGLPAERVQVGKTVGKCCYVAPNRTKAGRAANRRAEVVSVSVTFD